MLTGYRTFIGLIIAAVPNIAPLLGFDVSASFETEAAEAVTQVVTIIGLIIALYGRLKAQTPGWLAKRPPTV